MVVGEGAVAGRWPGDLSSLFPIPYSLTTGHWPLATGHLFPAPLPYEHVFNNLLVMNQGAARGRQNSLVKIKDIDNKRQKSYTKLTSYWKYIAFWAEKAGFQTPCPTKLHAISEEKDYPPGS